MKLFLFLFLSFFQYSFADTVFLKNGQVYDNVKANITQTSIEFQHKSRFIVLEKSKVKRIKFRPVIIKEEIEVKETQETEAKSEAPESSEKAEEDVNDYEKEETEKEEKSTSSDNKKIFVKFQISEGVSEEEVKTVKEKIFENLKASSFEIANSEMNESCQKEKGDCPSEADLESSSSKILYCNIAKVGEQYFINGNIKNQSNSNLEFSDTAIANSFEKLAEAADQFAQSLIDGNKTDSEKKSPKDSQGKIQYVWRSALIPGWGQYHSGETNDFSFAKAKGIGFFSLFSLSLGSTALSYSEFKKVESDYNSFHNAFLFVPTGDMFEQFLFLEDNRRNQAMLSAEKVLLQKIYFISFFYIINIVDSFFPKNYFLGFGNFLNPAPTKEIKNEPNLEEKPLEPSSPPAIDSTPDAESSILIVPEKKQWNSIDNTTTSPYFLFSYKIRF